MSQYNAETMSALEDLEHVQLRPTFYLGSTDFMAVLHCAKEIIDNCLDEHLAGHASEINVVVNKDGKVVVSDNGRGIPTDINKKTGLTGVQIAATKLKGGGKFNKDSYAISGGLNGVGLSVVNFLSEHCIITVHHNKKEVVYCFEKGIETQATEKSIKSNKTGTIVEFKLDQQFFSDPIVPEYDRLRDMLMQRAFLNSGIKITFKYEGYEPEVFHYENGLADYLDYLFKDKFPKDKMAVKPLYYHFKDEETGIDVEVAMSFSTSKSNFDPIEFSFCNSLNTFKGGKHLTGFRTGLTRAFNSVLAANDKMLTVADKKIKLTGEDLRENLVSIISIRHPNPLFVGNEKAELSNKDAQTALDSLTSKYFTEYLENNKNELKYIVAKTLIAAKSREASKRSREMIRKNNDLFSTSSAAKLTECESSNPVECEIYFAEGDSAAGTAKKARDNQTQAIFPLKGKILNTENYDVVKITKNTEIADIISVLGTGVGKSFDINNLNYHKIVILSDADSDGLHIASLQITLFLKHFKPLIENGFLYLSCPPLFTVKEGKDVYYLANDEDLKNFFTKRALRKLGIKARSIKTYSLAIDAINKFYEVVNHLSDTFTLPVEVIEDICFNLDKLTTKNNVIEIVSQKKVKVIGGISELFYDNNPYFLATDHFISEFDKVKEAFDNISNDKIVDIVNELLASFDENESLYNIAKTIFNYSQKGLEITYLKGLGEMSPEELWETTMNPKTRTLLKVVIEDDHLATENCSVLMGPASKYAEKRREIMDAAFANIDINQVDIQ